MANQGYDGTTTNSYFEVGEEDVGGSGLMAHMSIKNEDLSNSISLRVTVDDTFGVEDEELVLTILPGETRLIDCNAILQVGASARPPYSKIRAEVKSALPNLHANYKWRMVYQS